MRIFVLKGKTLILAAVAAAIAVALLLVALGIGGKESESEAGRSASARVNAEENYELEVLAGKQRELPIYSVARSDNRIALTIDAAWSDDKTSFILDELDRQGVKATFFLCGVWVDAYPEHVREIVERGHELGNHTQTHPHMNKLSADGIAGELKALDDHVEAITGKRSVLFRAPFGEYNDLVVTSVRALGYEPIQWSVDTQDWKKGRSAQTILDTVFSKLSSGAIILCHNNGYTIEEYLPALITRAKELGYEFVTVGELLLEGDTVIDVNGVQKKV